MLTSHIPLGKLVRVKTIGSKSEYSAPSLEFIGILKDESLQNFSGGPLPGCLQLLYDGKVARQNDEGRVIGFEKGEKVMTIPKRIVRSIEPLNTVGY